MDGLGLHRNFITEHMQQLPFIFSNQKKYRLQRHISFWLFWWLFQGFLYSFLAVGQWDSYPKQLALSMVESFLFMINHLFLAYGLMYFVIPRYLLQQRYLLTACFTVLLFLATAVISSLIAIFILPDIRYGLFNIRSENYRTVMANIFFALLAGLRGGITIGGIAAAIKLTKYWYLKEQRNMQLQKENMAAQLQLLKAQVHPHFLFNTLNNIYSFTQTSSPQAAKMVSGLSELLRFMLYEGNQPLVPLSKELKMVQDYINLEKIRYGNKLELALQLPEHTDDLYIAPLLLLPLVENCFKHGTSNMLEQPWINLQADIEGKQLRMKLINGKAPGVNPASPHAGIGLQNVQQRLDLLYPDRYEFTYTEEDEVFIVNLKIELLQKKQEIKKETILQPAHG